MDSMAALPAVVLPVADPSVYIVRLYIVLWSGLPPRRGDIDYVLLK